MGATIERVSTATINATQRRIGPVQWTISAAWIFLVLFIPVYRSLPGTFANSWTYATLALILAVILLGRAGKPKWPGIWVFCAFAAIVSGVLSSGNAGLGATLQVGAQMCVVIGLGVFAVRGSIIYDSKLLIRACAAFLVTQSISALAGVAQIGGLTVLGAMSEYGRSPGLAGHPNVLGVMSATAILICVSALLSRKSLRPMTVVVLAINVAGLVSTGSLSSMFACVFGAFVLLYAYGFRIGRIIAATIVIGGVLWALLQIPGLSTLFRDPLTRFYQVTGQTDDISTLSIRLDTYESAWNYISRDPLFGRGLDSADSDSLTAGTVVHNLFLRAWYQGGIFLAAGIGAILLAALIVVIRSIYNRQNALAVAVLVTVLSYALTSAFFQQAYYWLPALAAWATLPLPTGQAGSLNADEHLRGYRRQRADGE